MNPTIYAEASATGTGDNDDMSKLAYTIKDAAKTASVDRGTIVRAIQDGELQAREVDDDMRVLRVDIAKWLNDCPVWSKKSV